MLTLLTGTPGAAKTLWVIAEVERMRAAEGRPVYYFGIDGLTLDWIALEDPQLWWQCPVGSIIVIDECWQVFPCGKVGDEVPKHLQAMSEHRHEGHDVFLMTQHSTQVHTFVRKMTGRHVHLKRMFGMNRSAKFEWPEVANERDKWERKESARSIYKFDRKYFGTYKSSEMHTVKRRLPWVRIAVMGTCVAAVPVLLWVALSALWPDDVPVGADGAVVESGPATTSLLPGRAVGVGLTARSLAPAVADLPMSAPFYAGLMVARDFPRVDGCMRHSWSNGRDDCRCNDQQGNRLSLSYGACLAYLENGSFDFTGEDKRAQRERFSARRGSASEAPAGGAGGQ